jgi:hypothetical protein
VAMELANLSLKDEGKKVEKVLIIVPNLEL